MIVEDELAVNGADDVVGPDGPDVLAVMVEKVDDVGLPVYWVDADDEAV